MKKILLLLLFLPTVVFSQVTNEGRPLSWESDNSDIDKIELPSFDLQKLIEEDKENDIKGGKPWRFGYEHTVDIGMQNHGEWKNLSDGSRYWITNVSSEGAKTLNFIFDEFYIPEGGKLYFYNKERTDLLGAYTHTQNREDMLFGSWLVDGDNVYIEYFEPSNKIGQGKLHISKAIHGYRSVNDFKNNHKNLNSSGACNLDVDCTIGTDFDPLKDELKKSVGMIVLGSGFCTGSLVNNTNNDQSPYFLTADHCLGGNVGSWAFRFNWRSPNPVCASNTNSQNGAFDQTASGAVIRANNQASDFALLEITAPLPSSWDLVWNGWDVSTDVASYTVGIHHPSGDIMKVCRDDDSPQSIAANGQNLWLINEWETGVTEPGSSGSPLFNQDGRVIGVLTAGAAACNGTVNNGEFDVYGRLNHAWNNGSSSSTRLRDWLDPNNSGITTLDPFPNNLSTQSFLDFDLNIYPNPASTTLNIEGNFGDLNVELYDITGKLITTSNKNQLDVSSFNKGVYLLRISSPEIKQSLTRKIIID